MRMSAVLTKLNSPNVMRGQSPPPGQAPVPACCLARDQRLARLEQELRAEREREQVREQGVRRENVIMCCRKEGGIGKTSSWWASWLPVRTR